VIAVLAALQEEASGLRRRMALAPERVAGLGDPAFAGQYRGRPVLLAWTGMGRQRAEASVEAVLAHFRVTVVISIGFSGALERRLEVADLVLASELLGITGSGSDGIEPTIYQADRGLLHTATEALRTMSLRVVSGPIVTAPSIVTTPGDKQGMGWETGAVAVDMESYWVARAVSDQGLPFLVVRAITDAQEEFLPPSFQNLGAEGNPRARRLAAHLIREPGSLLALVRMARNAARARRALTTGVACTVAAL
jgi:5'-methylthioadenosine/S-adenosylhomocysteine nucleosidase